MSDQNTTCQTRKPYKTDLTDAQWTLIKVLIPPAVPKPGCEPTNLREILNTILYQNRTGCQWDMLPHGLCPSIETELPAMGRPYVAFFCRFGAGRGRSGIRSSNHVNTSLGFCPKNRSAAVVPSERLTM